jgi:tetratricopeptide (TPR) repeat protein
MDTETHHVLPVTTASEEARIRFMAGRLAAFHYDNTRAKSHLDAALESDPGFVLAYLHRGGMSNPEERGPFFEAARAHQDGVTADEALMVDAFFAFLWDGEVETAITIFSELADRYHDDPYLPSYLGLRYLHNLGRPDLARPQFQRAVERDPGFAPAHFWLGRAALVENDDTGAGEAYRRYRELAPDHPRPYDCVGLLHLRHGRHQEAEAAFREALTRDPGFIESRENLVRVRVDRQLRRLEKAVASGDSSAYPDLYSSICSVDIDGRRLSGPDEVSMYWADSVGPLEMSTGGFFLGMAGETATEVGQWSRGRDTGAYMTVWAITVGGWKIHRSIWTRG